MYSLVTQCGYSEDEQLRSVQCAVCSVVCSVQCDYSEDEQLSAALTLLKGSHKRLENSDSKVTGNSSI